MENKSIHDKSFKKYGMVVNHDFSDLISRAEKYTSNKCEYAQTLTELEESCDRKYLEEYFGFSDIQIGLCYGVNKMLNCLEYHKSSEVNIATKDMILLVGLQTDITSGLYDTSNIEGYLVKSGEAVELFATTLHYAPVNYGDDFATVIVLPKGTNYDLPHNSNDKLLYQTNKWLLAHKDSSEAKSGAYIGLVGENICLK